MIFNDNTAKEIAELLLQIKAIKLNPKNPFTWASGWRSPIYCDNRLLLSYPKVREQVIEAFAKQILTHFQTPDIIAGVATGAIGVGALVAQKLNPPFIYVRPEPKKHGRKNQIEGAYQKGQSVLVIEDLISTGGSSFQAIEALKDQDLETIGMAAIFSYGFDKANERIKQSSFPVYTLSNYQALLEEASNQNYINQNEYKLLSSWKSDPENWWTINNI